MGELSSNFQCYFDSKTNCMSNRYWLTNIDTRYIKKNVRRNLFIMSESDDSDIQADIEALTEALSLPTTSNSQQQPISNNIQSDSSSSINFGESDDEDFKHIYMNQDSNKSLNAYEINDKLITGLMIVKKQLIILLQECERKIKEFDEKINTRERSSLRTIDRISVNDVGMPYFKDKNHFKAPKNYDTKVKESRGELFLPSLRKPSRWTERDREKLLKAIHNEAIESVLSKSFNNEIDKPNKKTSSNQTENTILPRNFKEMVGAVGEKEFDWHKISSEDFDDKHSPGECQAMWNIYLHPAFNKSEWTNAEDKKLLQYAKKCKYQDWDTITHLLGTNRSAYQCFIRYNTIKKIPSSGSTWTEEEDKFLINIINKLKIGDYIPWTEVANHIRHRTKQQIYTRWMYRKAPHLKKGRWNYLETKTLLNAVEKYGTDFPKISNIVMPNRSSIQLNARYQTIIENMNENMWTVDDDERLLRLHKNYNNDWSKIATYFSNKSRTQVRHRFTAIVKYMKKNISLEDIPRPSLSKQVSKCEIKKRRILDMDDIQLRLYEILSSPPLETINSQESYDLNQLTYDTRRLYDTLNLLNANLDPNSFLNYALLNRKEKQLLASLKEYINVRNNGIQNHEQIEKFRMQMFGCIEEINKSSFIPPLPFDGYIKTKKIKNKNQSIDCELINDNEKFLIDMPIEFSVNPYIHSFINIEEEIQFHKFSEFLISDCYECNEQHMNLYKLLECNLSFDKTNTTPEYHVMDIMNDLELTNYNQKKCLNKLRTTINIECTNEEDNEERLFSGIIMPNRPTLLGLKNLLLWKLLYEHQNKSKHCKILFGDEQQETEQITTDCLITESIEYQLLQTRLLQLFKLPIGLSNAILELSGPEHIFLTKEENQKTRVSKKRKIEDDVNSAKLSKKTHNYIFANSNFKVDSNETVDSPIVRNCKVVYKKYKIIAQNI